MRERQILLYGNPGLSLPSPLVELFAYREMLGMNSIISPAYIKEVFDWAENLALSLATVERQREIFRIAFKSARSKEKSFPVCIHFPLLIYGLFREDIERAVPLAGVTTLFYMGVDLFDDIADGDLPTEVWKGVGAAEINLAAATLFFSLPLLAVRELEIPEITKSKMQDVLARGFLAMASGQHIDLHCAGMEMVSPDEIENSVLSKSGKELATFARLAALLADATGEQVERCASLGKAYGTAIQLTSDVLDIFAAPWSRDLAKGTRTLPIALHMDLLDGAKRENFVKILHQAETDRIAQESVCRHLIKEGIHKKMAFIAELYCGEARMHLDMLGPDRPSSDKLRTEIMEISFFNKV
jgi:geranylgeranyl pyrophosphate synthase